MGPVELSHKPSGKWVRWMWVLGLLLSVAWGLTSRLDWGLPAQLDNLFLDAFQKTSANAQTARGVVVVDVDDVSLSATGQWPWPRYRLASLVQKVAEAKPAGIGLDILFAEPDRTSLENIQKAFKQDLGLDITFGGVPNGVTDNDGYLGRVLADNGVVGARYFYFDHVSKSDTPQKPEFRFDGRLDLLSLNDAPGVLNNTAPIASQLRFGGFLNTQRDRDGMLRRVPMLIKHAGVIYPHLSLATFLRSQGLDSATIAQDRYGTVIRAGRYAIPIDEHGYVLLRFNGPPELYPAISAVDVLNGTVDPAALANKIVFIGSSAAALNDLHGTVFDMQFPGLKVQSVIADNILAGHFARELPWSDNAILLLCIAVGAVVTLMFIQYADTFFLSLAAVAMVGFTVAACAYLFHATGIFLSPAAPVTLTAVLFTLLTVTRFIDEKRQSYVWYKKLANARQVTMESMAAIAETRDPETGAHIKRTQYYVKAVAERLRAAGQHPQTLTQEYIELLFVSAPLHDIGKVGVPDHILLKPGKLTDEEFVLMKKHAEYGKNIIHSTAQKIEGDNFLVIAGEIASTHHEKWDGTGYPLGLAGENIPLSGRIMSVADVYDALISRRCYKPPFSHAESMDIMRKSRGTMFDPAVFDAFVSIEPEIQTIAARYRDDNELVVGDR
ncbi:MAG: CHASE2 domain-containing protein [Betaproteobacteria bacterium]